MAGFTSMLHDLPCLLRGMDCVMVGSIPHGIAFDMGHVVL